MNSDLHTPTAVDGKRGRVTPQPQKNSAASSLPRLACIGATRGAHVIHNWQKWGFVRASAVCDLDPAIAEKEADAMERDGFSRPRTFANAEALLSAGEFDGVVVATPDATHHGVAADVLRRGIPCLIEKPMAVTLDEAADLCHLTRRHGTLCMVGHEFRHAAAIVAAKDMLRAGRIGTPRLAVTLDFCGRMGSYWRRSEWRDGNRPEANSLTLQKAIHQLDIQTHLLGDRPSRAFVSAGQTHFGGDRPAGLKCETCAEAAECLYTADRLLINGRPNPRAAKDHLCVFGEDVHLHDHQAAVIDYAGGGRGTYVECFFTPDYRFEHMIIGDRGRLSIRYRVGDPQMELRTEMIGSVSVEITRPVAHGPHGGGDYGLGAAFARAIANGRAEQPTVVDGFNAVALAAAMDASAASGQPEEVGDIPPASDTEEGITTESQKVGGDVA